MLGWGANRWQKYDVDLNFIENLHFIKNFYCQKIGKYFTKIFYEMKAKK